MNFFSPTSKQSVFHRGELAAQRLAGTRESADQLGHVLKTSLSLNTGLEALFATLRVAWISTLIRSPSTNQYCSEDDGALPWVFPVLGRPGFVQIINHKEISIELDDNFLKTYDYIEPAIYKKGNLIAFLAIDLVQRVRYRTNGRIKEYDSANHILKINVEEAFPNCPKYIQKREILSETENLSPSLYSKISNADELSESDIDFVKNSDTFFLGTHFENLSADISHRGGQAGFVRVSSNTELFWPDYRGNGMFQSNGNMLVNKQTALTFLNFSSGKVLQLTGLADIQWRIDDQLKSSMELASERIIRFYVKKVQRTNGPVTSFKWKMVEISPYSPDLPMLVNGNGTIKQSFPVTCKLVRIVNETENIKTFRFLSPKLIKFLPGQYATIEFKKNKKIETDESTIVRTWTLSDITKSMDGGDTLDVTIRRKLGGIMSNFLHDHAKLGMQVQLKGIGGLLTPFGNENTIPKKIALISAGIGITPSMAILRGIGARLDSSASDFPDVILLHQDKQLNYVPFVNEIERRSLDSKGNIRPTMYFSKEQDPEGLDGIKIHSGRLKEDDLKEHVSDIENRVVYLCGPAGFMDMVSSSLINLGARSEDINIESFDF